MTSSLANAVLWHLCRLSLADLRRVIDAMLELQRGEGGDD